MPKTKFVCQQCGKEFYRWASKYPNGIAKYCSLKCNGLAQKDKETEHRHKIKCDNCSKEFLIYDNREKKSNNLFCSMKCLGEFKNKHVEIKCQYCGKTFLVKKSRLEKQNPRFCSWSCRSKYLVGTQHFNFTAEKKICKQCGKEFYPQLSEVKKGKGIYCSKKCAYKSMELKRPPDTKEFYSTALWKRLKLECLERDNYTCQKCGIKGGSELHAHHKIPRAFGGKDEINNLTTLCNHCHLKVEKVIRIKLKTIKKGDIYLNG